MTIAVTVTNKWSDTKREHVIGTLVFSSTYAQGGQAITWVDPAIKSQRSVLRVEVDGKNGYQYAYDRANLKILIYQQNGVLGPLVEISNGAYPAGVTGDIVDFYAIFNQNV